MAGIAAFLGLAVLALLYFAQARDVRRLRENAEFLVEAEPTDDGEPAPPPTAVSTAPEPEQAARAAAASAPNEAEAFRRAELARQAAERRQRFESRRRGEEGGLRDRIRSGGPSTIVIAVGALILLAGIGFGATRLIGDDGSSGGGGGGQANESLACTPRETKVAVLNSTPEAGLAGRFAKQLKQRGYDVGPVSNTESPFETSMIMFDQGAQQCATEIQPIVSINATAAMDQEVRGISEGAALAVVLGEDKATGAASTTTESAGATGTLGD